MHVASTRLLDDRNNGHILILVLNCLALLVCIPQLEAREGILIADDSMIICHTHNPYQTFGWQTRVSPSRTVNRVYNTVSMLLIAI